MDYSAPRDAVDEHNPFSYRNFLNRYGTARDGLPPPPAPLPPMGRGGTTVNGTSFRPGAPPQQMRMPNRGVVPPVRLQHQEHPRRLSNGGGGGSNNKIHDVRDIFADDGNDGSGEDDFTHNPPFVHPEWLNGHQEKEDEPWLHLGNGSAASSNSVPTNLFPSDLSSPAGFDSLGGHMAGETLHLPTRRNSSDRALANRLAGGSGNDNAAGTSNIEGIDFVTGNSASGNSRLDERMYINKLRKDVAFYKRKLEEVENYADQTSQELQRSQAELDAIRVRERNETEAMEKVMQHVEANLQATTRRAMDAETALAALIEENRALKEHIAELAADNDTLRARANNDVRKMPSFERAHSLAKFLQASCQSANMMLRDMLDGVEQIHLASVALESLGSIEEAHPPSTTASQQTDSNSTSSKQQQLSTNNNKTDF